jgi:gliding motility-associated-like protein
MTHHYRTPNSLPNGDGFNDNWKIKFSDNEIGLSIQLFDRYGKLIKELTQNNSWDGMLNGHELPYRLLVCCNKIKWKRISRSF